MSRDGESTAARRLPSLDVPSIRRRTTVREVAQWLISWGISSPVDSPAGTREPVNPEQNTIHTE